MKKNNKKKKIFLFIILAIVLIIIGYFIGSKAGSNSQATSNTTSQVVSKQVSTQTITNTLTSSAEVSSSSTEELSLSTSKYFSTMCVEEGDSVEEGDNILKYSNGTYLQAPYDCVIGEVNIPETGSICTSSNYIEVQNLETLIMTLSIDESEINTVKVGQSVEITLSAFEGKTYEGTISKINSVGTYSSSGTSFTATVEFENDGNVKIGMSASCTIILEEAENVIAVPIAAVQESDSSKYVIVVNSDGTTKNVEVETGISNDSYVEIKSGLTGTETVQMIETTTSGTVMKGSSSSSSSNSSGFSGGRGSMSQGTSGSTMGVPGGGTMPQM